MKYLICLSLFVGCSSLPTGPVGSPATTYGFQVLHCIDKQGRVELELKIVDLEEQLIGAQKLCQP